VEILTLESSLALLQWSSYEGSGLRYSSK
jgi:hypothetical protein